MSNTSPHIARSLQLTFIGDWGQANFHRVCSWLAQELCERAGPRSRVGILNLHIRDGGMQALAGVHDGEAHMTVATPATLMALALQGYGPFPTPFADLRALATLPQNDRLLLAVAPHVGVQTFEELRAKRPPLRVAASANDGSNFIGYVAARMMEAHGITRQTLESWGGAYVYDVRPDQSLARMKAGEVDAVVQEAIMTPWWDEVVQRLGAHVLPAEPAALELLRQQGIGAKTLPAGYWPTIGAELPAVDFSDFVLLVRDDLSEDIAHLLTWCVVETRAKLERQYRHLPSRRSPVTYPLDPREMARTAVPLHRGAERYYRESRLLDEHPK